MSLLNSITKEFLVQLSQDLITVEQIIALGLYGLGRLLYLFRELRFIGQFFSRRPLGCLDFLIRHEQC